jgi:hypothetical protein
LFIINQDAAAVDAALVVKNENFLENVQTNIIIVRIVIALYISSSFC